MATICQLHADLRYYLCLEPVDMRKQFQGLQGIINKEFGRYLTPDEAFIFIGKSRTTAKILHREAGGLTMYVRKLTTGRFQMPKAEAGGRSCTVGYAEFVRLIVGEGCEIRGRFSQNGERLETPEFSSVKNGHNTREYRRME